MATEPEPRRLRFAYRVDGTRFSNLRFVSDDYVLQANEREGWTEGALPRINELPGYVARLPPQQQIISRRQFFQAAADKGMISQQEALDAMTGTIPARMQEGLNTLPPEQKFAAEMILTGANEFNRYHPLVEKFGEVMGMPPPVLDEIWKFAGTL